MTGSEIGRVASGARRGEDLLTKAAQKITLSLSQDIPFDKLVLSQSNVRRIKAGVSVEELAEDIARRGLLQSLNVRAVLDAAGVETGMFEIPAGGRRFQALSLLVKQKRLAKTNWASGCKSWYLTADGFNATMYPGFATQYAQELRHFQRGDYHAAPAAGAADRAGLALQT